MGNRRTYFSVFVSTLLIVDCVSAGLLQSIREAAMLKDYLTQNTRDARALELDQPPSNLISNDLFHFDINGEKSCPPGDFVCIAQKHVRKGANNEMSNAIVKSVATIMTEMLNSTISRSLLEMTTHSNSKDPNEAAEARVAMSMVSTALQMVSSKVIQAFASFVKVAISGAMWDLFNTMVRAARSSPKEQSNMLTSLQASEKMQFDHKSINTVVNPSNMNNDVKHATS